MVEPVNIVSIIIMVIMAVVIISQFVYADQLRNEEVIDEAEQQVGQAGENAEVIRYNYNIGGFETALVDEHIDDQIRIEQETELVQLNTLVDLSGVTEAELASVLKYDLKSLAKTFVQAEQEYGVNAIYLAAISALESGWGRYQFKENNIFGFGNMDFESEEDCIIYVADFLSREYLTPDGLYYGGGYSLSHVNEAYNGSQHWLDEVSKIADKIADSINELRKGKC